MNTIPWYVVVSHGQPLPVQATGGSGVMPSQSSCLAAGILRANEIAVFELRHLFAHAF